MSDVEERGADMDRRELEAEILVHLEEKADHEYRWPRWPAAYEAAQAVLASDWLAAHDAQVRAEALAPIGAFRAEWERTLAPSTCATTRALNDALRAAMEAKG